MHENVFPIFGVDVTVPFGAIKPAHHAGCALRQEAASNVLQRRNFQVSFVVKSITHPKRRQFRRIRQRKKSKGSIWQPQRICSYQGSRGSRINEPLMGSGPANGVSCCWNLACGAVRQSTRQSQSRRIQMSLAGFLDEEYVHSWVDRTSLTFPGCKPTVFLAAIPPIGGSVVGSLSCFADTDLSSHARGCDNADIEFLFEGVYSRRLLHANDRAG